jgi:hypothetical protein
VTGGILWARVVFEGSEGADLSLALLGEDAPDISVVEALARLQVVCQRSGMRVRLEQTCSMLEELLELAGLGGVIESGEVIESGGVIGSGVVGSDEVIESGGVIGSGAVGRSGAEVGSVGEMISRGDGLGDRML